MAELYLVRHGQASFGERDYDALSALGRQQSRWLGEYFAQRGLRFDHVHSGSMRRHRETVSAIAEGLDAPLSAREEAGLDEYDFGALVHAFHTQFADPAFPEGTNNPQTYYRTLKKALKHWSNGELAGELPETWAQFGKRVIATRRALQAAATKGQRILVVSSGGPISRLLAEVLEAPAHQAIELNMQLYNTGLSRLYFNAENIMLSGFNAIPHLDMPGRFDAITYG